MTLFIASLQASSFKAINLYSQQCPRVLTSISSFRTRDPLLISAPAVALLDALVTSPATTLLHLAIAAPSISGLIPHLCLLIQLRATFHVVDHNFRQSTEDKNFGIW
jgi:hypothetical protein